MKVNIVKFCSFITRSAADCLRFRRRANKTNNRTPGRRQQYKVSPTTRPRGLCNNPVKGMRILAPTLLLAGVGVLEMIWPGLLCTNPSCPLGLFNEMAAIGPVSAKAPD